MTELSVSNPDSWQADNLRVLDEKKKIAFNFVNEELRSISGLRTWQYVFRTSEGKKRRVKKSGRNSKQREQSAENNATNFSYLNKVVCGFIRHNFNKKKDCSAFPKKNELLEILAPQAELVVNNMHIYLSDLAYTRIVDSSVYESHIGALPSLTKGKPSAVFYLGLVSQIGLNITSEKAQEVYLMLKSFFTIEGNLGLITLTQRDFELGVVFGQKLLGKDDWSSTQRTHLARPDVIGEVSISTYHSNYNLHTFNEGLHDSLIELAYKRQQRRETIRFAYYIYLLDYLPVDDIALTTYWLLVEAKVREASALLNQNMSPVSLVFELEKSVYFFSFMYQAGKFPSEHDMWSFNRNKFNDIQLTDLINGYLFGKDVIRRHILDLTQELDAIFHILSTTELRNLKLSEDHLKRAKSGNIIIDLAGRKHTFGLRGLEGQLRQLGLNSIHFSHREGKNYYSVSLEFLDGKIEFGLGLSDLELVGLGEASQPLRQWLEAIAIFYLGEAKHSNIDLIREKDKAEVMPQDNKEVGEMGRSPHLVILPLGKGPDHRGQWFATDWNETLIEQWGFDLLTLNALFILAQIKLVQGGGNEETTIIDSMLLQVVEESLEELKNSFSKEINTKSLMNITIKLLRRSFARSFARRFPVDYEEHSPSLFQLFNQVMTGNFNHVALRKHDEQVAHGLKKFSKKWNFYMVTLNHGNSKRPVPFTVDSERLASFTSPPAIKTS